jgi:hypothetical protein
LKETVTWCRKVKHEQIQNDTCMITIALAFDHGLQFCNVLHSFIIHNDFTVRLTSWFSLSPPGCVLKKNAAISSLALWDVVICFSKDHAMYEYTLDLCKCTFKLYYLLWYFMFLPVNGCTAPSFINVLRKLHGFCEQIARMAQL